MSAQLVIALDLPSASEALALASSLRPVTPWMKVGLELFTSAGPKIVEDLKKMDCLVFLDLKFHDIPNTVRSAVYSAFHSGADMCNLHLCGGEEMCRAGVEALRDLRARGFAGTLLGVTVLTSQDSAGPGADVASVVLERARNAKAWGLDGVVLSAREAALVKRECGPDLICLCPGIRPEKGRESPARSGGFADDQRRVLTPGQAVKAGADYLVVGRPITRAENPPEAARLILESF
ncbi:orotidine-5'-phosphate decarboxylase [Desulfovibrio sp. OttesenSCG-928-C14]|nr:orotidine-5'-phosphate decarboxylase [Desulfovibrio sp. OttesenSCG-928-C14]